VLPVSLDAWGHPDDFMGRSNSSFSFFAVQNSLDLSYGASHPRAAPAVSA